MKRLISCFASDLNQMTSKELKQSIKASEGRVLMGESIITASPLINGITNAEIMASFGSDLLLLNELDVFKPKINGFTSKGNIISEIKRLTGRLVGINLEPIDKSATLMDNQVVINKGRQASEATFAQAQKLGIDFILITGNPSTGVSNKSILKAIKTAKSKYKGLIFAGKMHSSGIQEDYLDFSVLKDFIKAGADGIVLPCAGTVPGIMSYDLANIVKKIKSYGALTLGSIGTSQEGASVEDIKRIGLLNKEVGFDIYHIGDGGFGRIAPPENILALSITIRGIRHTYFRIAQSPLR